MDIHDVHWSSLWIEGYVDEYPIINGISVYLTHYPKTPMYSQSVLLRITRKSDGHTVTARHILFISSANTAWQEYPIRARDCSPRIK